MVIALAIGLGVFAIVALIELHNEWKL